MLVEKKSQTVSLCYVPNRKNSWTIQDYVYTVQVTLLNPLWKCNERRFGNEMNTENGLKLVAQCLHLALLQVFHNSSLYSGNLECMSIRVSAAWRSRTDSPSFIPGFSHSQTNHSFVIASCGQWRVEEVSSPSWLPSVACGGKLYGPHTLWLMALMAACVLMEAETWMTFGQLSVSLKTTCDWLSGACWQWSRSGRVCSAVTWRYNQAEAFGSGAVWKWSCTNIFLT